MVIGFILLFVWLTGWIYGCLVLTMQIIEKPTVLMICFAVPFWASCFAVLGVMLVLMFGRQTLRLDGDGLLAEYHVLVRTHSQQVPLADVGRFRMKKHPSRRTVSYSIKVKTDGKPIVFWVDNHDEAQWLTHELNRMLADLRGGEPVADGKKQAKSADIPRSALPRHLAPPSDCRWKIRQECDSVVFQRRGNYSVTALAGSTFIMLFWDGLLSMGLVAFWGFQPGSPELFTAHWWAVFVFLIPFELLGLAFFLGWFSLVSAFFRRIQWRISRSEAVCRITQFGISRTWRYSLEDCRKTSIRPWKAPPEGCLVLMPSFGLETGDRRLVFVDSEGRALCEIPDLTPGEARWMADNVLGYR